jgi:small-conductance mechanosensitive channel
MIDYLQTTHIIGNSLFSLVVSGSLFLLMLLAMVVLRLPLRGRMKRLQEEDKPLALLLWLDKLLPLLPLIGAWVGFYRLDLPETADTILRGAFTLLLIILMVRTLIFLTEKSLHKWAAGQEVRYRPLLTLFRLTIWLLASIFFLGNLGFDISAVVAGLGVSGIAVAIAAQGILGDLFNYFVILFDRPFEMGDFIIFGDKMGSVEKIGIKTTRIRAISGEQLVVSNSALTGSQIHNYKRMARRRVLFRIGITYETEKAFLREIPGFIREIIDTLEQATFDRSHFASFGDYALIFESVYYVESSDYLTYMNIQEEINLQLSDRFEEKGIEFAYPTQVVHLSGAQDKG